MATAHAYLVLMPETLLLASVNLVNIQHWQLGQLLQCSACVCLSAVVKMPDITVSHRLISLGATFCCCQMC